MSKLIIIGGSAGSLDVILSVFPKLRDGFTIPIIIVLHRKVSNDTILTDLLAAKTTIIVKEIEEKEAIAPATIYIVPADYHVLIEQDHTFTLDYSERINYSRPSIDVVFQSAADVYGSELCCVLLSGANVDGAEGLKYVKSLGGISIVQDPHTAEVSYMPEQAIIRNAVDHIYTPDEIADFLNELT